jgi:hypothetical protein
MRKTQAKTINGFSRCTHARTARTPADTANQRVIIASSRRRSVMSAKAPAGRVKRKNGRAATVESNEIKKLDGLRVFITQVAAVSCADTQQPEIRLATQSCRNTGLRRDNQIELFVMSKLAIRTPLAGNQTHDSLTSGQQQTQV